MTFILDIGAVSPLGEGREGWSNGALGAKAPQKIRPDTDFFKAGLKKPYAARVSDSVYASRSTQDLAHLLLANVFEQIKHRIPQEARIGIALGSSSGAMETSTELFNSYGATNVIDATLAKHGQYWSPFQWLLLHMRDLGYCITRSTHILAACSSSTLALGIAHRWLEANLCDIVIAGGYDALSLFVAAGFEALRATTSSIPPKPFRQQREGMALGEGACLFVLSRTPTYPFIGQILGFGCTGDAFHLTAPIPNGIGLRNAALMAINDSNVSQEQIGLISCHGTATRLNDAMESNAIHSIFQNSSPPIHAAKASIGHTLGASGALETALMLDALERNLIPATAGEGALDSACSFSLYDTNKSASTEIGLKLSTAFGGVNAALVVGNSKVARTYSRPTLFAAKTVARISVVSHMSLANLSKNVHQVGDYLGRMSLDCHLALSVLVALAQEVGRDRIDGAGIVLGSLFPVLDHNYEYARRLKQMGPLHIEGRRFAYTTPNAAAAECAIEFQLTGPNITVSQGHNVENEVLELAHDFICLGDSERMVAVYIQPETSLVFEMHRALQLPIETKTWAVLLEKEDIR